MAVRRFVRFAGQSPTSYVGQYIHIAGGKIGVQVEFGGVDPQMAGARRVRDAGQGNRHADRGGEPCLRRARRPSRPTSSTGRSPSTARRWKARASRPQVIDKIVEGKLGSFYSQVVLPDQPSIRDPKMTVADVLAAAAKTLGAPVTVTRFARLKVGEAA